MRSTPAQLAVELICGNIPLEIAHGMTRRQQLEQGRAMLRSITRQDFGFDLQKWHDYLKESREGGYTWNRAIDLPKIMKSALADPEWSVIVATIESAENKR